MGDTLNFEELLLYLKQAGRSRLMDLNTEVMVGGKKRKQNKCQIRQVGATGQARQREQSANQLGVTGWEVNISCVSVEP